MEVNEQIRFDQKQITNWTNSKDQDGTDLFTETM